MRRRWISALRKRAPSLFEACDEFDGLWQPDKFDYAVWGVHVGLVAIQWLFTLVSGDLLSPLAYWDGPNYVYVAKTMYDIPEDNPWTRAFNYPRYYFACHLPGFPLVIKLFSMIFFNCYWIGDVVAILFCSCLSLYVFRRMLIVYNCVSEPLWTTMMMCVFPIRYLVYSAVGASEPLFLSCCYGAMTFYKLGKKVPMLLCLWGATITRIEGLSIVGTIGLCYALQIDILGCLWTMLGFLAPAALVLMHKQKFGSYKAYFMFNQNLIQFPPFHMLIHGSKYDSSVPNLMGCMYMYGIMLIGVLILCQVAVPMAIFATVYLIYDSMLFHIDVYRYALPGYILCILIGFDCIWSQAQFKLATPIIGVIYSFHVFGYSTGQMVSNRAWRELLVEVMNT